MRKMWFDEAWNDYMFWQNNDRKTIKRINALIKDIERNGASVGIGKPEPLRGNLSGFFSRHIDDKHRLVYRIASNILEIASCKGHYDDK